MFEILPNPSLDTVLIAGRALLLAGAFWVFALAFVRWRRTDEREAQHLRAQLERTFAEMRSLHETVAVMSARLESLSERTESDARLAPAGSISSQRGYDLAARLAKNGSHVDELVVSCGITRHEAELLTRLHGARTREREAAPAWQKRAAPVEKQPAAAWPAQGAEPAAPPKRSSKRGSLLSVVG